MKNVVITGSTRGIGLEMAKEFLKLGCNVTISGRSESSFNLAKKELASFSKNILYVPCNVTNYEEIENLCEASKKHWKTIDIWINNAGQNAPYEYVFNTEKSSIDSIIDTNIKGVVFGSNIAATQMFYQGYGQIYNMEGLGSNNMIQIRTILYGMTKHSLTYYTKGLAKELSGTEILIGRLSPGMMLTDFITNTPSVNEESFKKIFNILADKPETVAAFLVPKMLKNKKNNAHIMWLTNRKVMFRFFKSLFIKRKLI